MVTTRSTTSGVAQMSELGWGTSVMALLLLGGCLAIGWVAGQWWPYAPSRCCGGPLIERRLTLYETGFNALVRIRSFNDFTGDWRDIDPRQILVARRQLNGLLLHAAPIFSAAVLTRYLAFMDQCFWVDPAGMARIRASLASHKASRGLGWHDGWEPLFVPTSAPAGDAAQVTHAYEELMSALATDFGCPHPVQLEGL